MSRKGEEFSKMRKAFGFSRQLINCLGEMDGFLHKNPSNFENFGDLWSSNGAGGFGPIWAENWAWLKLGKPSVYC